MLNIFTVAFFGHRNIEDSNKIYELLQKNIFKLLNEKKYVDFLVGRNGDFDQLASSVVLQTRKEYRGDNSSLVLVLPYYTAEYFNNKQNFENYYSQIEVSFSASRAFPKAAIQLRNREMVDRADLIICCIDRNSGGAYKAVRYAMEQKKLIINLGKLRL